MTSRRSFLVQAASLVGLASLAPRLNAAPTVDLEETDPTGQALGYKKDTKQVDGKKYPNHKPEQRCDGCALYTGKAGEAKGPCGAFGGKMVTAQGWCMAYAKRP